MRYGLVSIIAAIVLAFAFTSASAQASSPAAQPTPQGFFAPVKPPKGWGAEQWARMRKLCLGLSGKVQKHIPLTRQELRDADTCDQYIVVPPSLRLPRPGVAVEAPSPSGPPPKAMPTPLPEVAPESSADPPAGPFGTPFAGGGGDACSGTPPVQPPDVAADVSPAENAEFLNEGLYVYDKQGGLEVQPTSLSDFWCPSGSSNPLPGCGTTNSLTDTQIAFDQIAQRWLATTLSLAPDKTGNIYFAASDTSSAAGGWTLYDYPNACSYPSGTSTPDPDQPILGYDGNWVVIDVLCLNSSAVAGNDNILTIPHSQIAETTLPQTLSWGIQQASTFAARPTRDIGATSVSDSYPDVFLVSAETGCGSSSQPCMAVQEIGPSTSNPPPITGAGPGGAILTSPAMGATADSLILTNAAQPYCSPTSNCAVSLGASQITGAVLQKGNDGNHYLLTSFMAEDSPDQTTQALWYAGQAETFASSTPKWDNWWVGGWSQSNAWGTYPTIAMDKDLDITYTFETFGPNYDAYPDWYTAKAFQSNQSYSDPALGLGILDSASSTGEYFPEIVCGAPATRWGDYVTTVWDPNFSSPNESDSFWTVQEYTTGQSNESTLWQALADPLPFFVGYSLPTTAAGNAGEDECDGGAGSDCKLTYSAPTGIQPGDLLVAEIGVGEWSGANYVHLPAGWTLLPVINHNNNFGIVSTDGALYTTNFVAAHIYGSEPNDPGQYTFGITIQNTGSEIVGFLVAYRGASAAIPGQYLLYGFPSNQNSNFVRVTAGKVTPQVESTVLDLFEGDCVNNDTESEEKIAFGAPTGTPTLAPETPLNPTSNSFFMAADAPVPTPGVVYGPYKSYVCTQYVAGGVNTAYQLIIPE
jgi:hypothetical protein